MSKETDKLFRKIKDTTKEILEIILGSEKYKEIEECCNDITSYVDDISEEVDQLEGRIDNLNDDIDTKDTNCENNITTLLSVIKEIYETKEFSKTNENLVNEIATQTNNDSKLLWSHNIKIK